MASETIDTNGIDIDNSGYAIKPISADDLVECEIPCAGWLGYHDLPTLSHPAAEQALEPTPELRAVGPGETCAPGRLFRRDAPEQRYQPASRGSFI